MSHDFPSSGELAGHRNPYLSADPGGVMVWGCDRARGHTGESEVCIKTFKEQMHLELELPRLPANRPTSPKISPRSSPRNSPCFFRKLLVNKSIRQRRRFTVAHTW